MWHKQPQPEILKFMKTLKSLVMICIIALAPITSAAQKLIKSGGSKPSETTFSEAEAAGGLLFKISGNGLGKPSYLFGTLHAICPNDLFGLERLSFYFGQTERLFLELDLDDPQVLSKAATALDMPEGKTLRHFLQPEKYARVDEMFRHILGVRVSTFGRVSPLGLAAIVSGSPQATGCTNPVSYETKLIEIATAAGKTVEGLESVEDQIAALNIKPIEKQAEDLYRIALDPQKPINEFKELVAVYKDQNAEELIRFIARQTSGDPQLAAKMLTERNRRWLPEIEKILNEKPTLIAVGGGHLGGSNGVVNLLRQQGYTVTAIKI